MSGALIDLTARRHTSRVLDAWIASRPGADARAAAAAPAIRAMGENSSMSGLTLEELVSMLGVGSTSSAGVRVTPDSAMRVATVYACVSLIAGAVASLPVGIYERKGKERDRADHDYWWMLNEQANENMTSAAAWEYIVTAKLFHGDGIAKLLRPSPLSSRVIGWEPLDPLRVQPFRSPDDHTRIYYRHQPITGPQEILDPADVLHLPSLGFDGLTSPSPITYAAREAIGTSLAAQQYHGKFFSSGLAFDYALKTEQNMKEQQVQDLLGSLLRRQNDSRFPLLLTGGLEPAALSINPKDAQIVEILKLGIEDLCRLFGVPPHMVGHTEKTTSWGTGIEQQGIGFVRHTLQRYLTPIAQELNRKLWPTRQRFFVEHITAALERGDLKGRFEAYRIALGRAGEDPFMAIDEIRRIENMPPNSNLQRNQGSGSHAQPPDPAAG